MSTSTYQLISMEFLLKPFWQFPRINMINMSFSQKPSPLLAPQFIFCWKIFTFCLCSSCCCYRFDYPYNEIKDVSISETWSLFTSRIDDNQFANYVRFEECHNGHRKHDISNTTAQATANVVLCDFFIVCCVTWSINKGYSFLASIQNIF